MQKESAYLHVPTYAAGLFFHAGSFIALLLFLVFFFVNPTSLLGYLTLKILVLLLAFVLLIGIICGCSLFFKRLFSKKMRYLSTLDDYLSCFLTTIFQVFTVLYLVLGDNFAAYYYTLASILLLYIPVGKLRHIVYFFAARYHLGFFYGWRNSWPPDSDKK